MFIAVNCLLLPLLTVSAWLVQVRQLKGERSYHIFYQLVRGCKDKAEREMLRLPNKPTEYAYLAKSGCTVGDTAGCAASHCH